MSRQPSQQQRPQHLATMSSIMTMSFFAIPSGYTTNRMIVPLVASSLVAQAKEDKDLMPWEREGWVPRTASGKQKTPNQIRGELQRYIDSSCETQTAIVDRLGVNNNSFRKFMNPQTYKNKWSATGNGTYWAAAKFLAQAKHDKEQSKKQQKKRKASDDPSAETPSAGVAAAPKRSKSEARLEAEQLISRINGVTLFANQEDMVYDSCPELVKKIKEFLATDGVTKSAFCDALGSINNNLLNTFLMGKHQDQCGNITYRRAYAFFERKRLLEGKPKTARRLKNEAEHPHGFSLQKARPGRYHYGLSW